MEIPFPLFHLRDCLRIPSQPQNLSNNAIFSACLAREQKRPRFSPLPPGLKRVTVRNPRSHFLNGHSIQPWEETLQFFSRAGKAKKTGVRAYFWPRTVPEFSEKTSRDRLSENRFLTFVFFSAKKSPVAFIRKKGLTSETTLDFVLVFI